SSRRRHTRFSRDWSSDVCSSDLVRARARAGEAVIEVMDSGPGVPLEERESIFNLFFRGRTKADTGVKGSGMGLAIARELVEAHRSEERRVGKELGGAGGRGWYSI